MRWHDVCQLSGRITVYTVDPRVGDLADVERLFARIAEAPQLVIARAASRNKTTLNGKRQALALPFAQGSTFWSHVAFGINSAAPTLGDAALYDEKIRVPIASVTPTDDGVNAMLTVRAVLSQTQGNGFTYTEAAIVNAAVGGLLYNRVVYPPVEKTDQYYLFAQFDLTQK